MCAVADQETNNLSPNDKKTLSSMYILYGDPIPLNRPRYANGHVYDSQKACKLVAGINLKNQHGSRPLFSGILHLDIEFYMQAPVKQYKKMIGHYHCFKPDIDNLLKFVFDSATNVIIRDDCLISSVSAFKFYDKEPRTVIFIKELSHVR